MAPAQAQPGAQAVVDEFDGTALDAAWSVVSATPDGMRVKDGHLEIDTLEGDLYQASNTAKNIVVRDLPTGAWEATTVVTAPVAEAFQQAGLILFSDADNYAVAALSGRGAGVGRMFFMTEMGRVARVDAADRIEKPIDQWPDTYHLRLASDGVSVTAQWSADGASWEPLGRPVSTASFPGARIGLVAYKGATTAPTITAAFDRFELKNLGETPPADTTRSDEFGGSTLNENLWSVVDNQQDALRLKDGALEIDTISGDLYGVTNTARNLVLQDVPEGAWDVTTKISAPLAAAYQQAGLMLYSTKDDYAAFGLAARPNGSGRMFYLWERNGTVRNDVADWSEKPMAQWPQPYYLRLASDGLQITASWSSDGARWTALGRPVSAMAFAGAKVGLFAYRGEQNVPTVTARFDYFRVNRLGPGLSPQPGATQGTVRPIDWDSFSASTTVNADSQRLEAILANANQYALTTWATTNGFDEGRYVDLGGDTELQVRGPAAQAMGLAAALGTGVYDAGATGVPREQAVEITRRLIRSLAYQHVANNPSGWSGPVVDTSRRLSQSALWAAMAGYAGWLMWDELDDNERQLVQAMVEYEADRFLTYEPTYWTAADGRVLMPGNTQAEENSWNSMMLQVATAMVPEHPHWEQWQTKNVALLLAAFSRPSDVTSTAVYHGRPLSEWIKGWNMEDNGVSYNHNMLHPDYMATLVQSLHAATTAPLAGLPVPKAALHNADVVYRALVDLEFPSPPYDAPGGTIYIDNSDAAYYPEGTDWGASRRMHFAAMDVMVGDLGLDTGVSTRAQTWEKLHASAALAMQERHADGRTYAAGDPDEYRLREEWISSHAAWAHLSRWLADRRAVTVSNAPVAELQAPVVDAPHGKGTQRLKNVALASNGATVTASGQETPTQWGPANVIDGVVNKTAAGAAQSRWSSNLSHNAWVAVKLAKPTVIDHVAFEWENLCAKRYKVQVSQDGTTWVDATGEVTGTCNASQRVNLDALTAQQKTQPWSHVRMWGIERTKHTNGQYYGMSMWEFEVWARDGQPAIGQSRNLALAINGGTVSASGSELATQWGPQNTIDGKVNKWATGAAQSRWSSNRVDDASITVKLAQPSVIDHVVLEWETLCAKRYRVQVSADGETWVDATDELNGNCNGTDIRSLSLLTAAERAQQWQFVRMQGLERTPNWDGRFYGMSLWEFEVWDGPEPGSAPADVNPLPRPAQVVVPRGAEPFTLTESSAIVAPDGAAGSGALLAALLRPATGFELPVVPAAEGYGHISLELDPSLVVEDFERQDEAYYLSVDVDGVALRASTEHGLFNGIQTLRQLFPAFVESSVAVNTAWAVPATEIADAPRFEHRAIMVDVARSFLTVQEMKDILDAMARAKLSVLHFHIADDQGWRIEITNEGRAEGDDIDYTLLTKISGQTAVTEVNEGAASVYQNRPGHTGFYTQDDYSEIVAYASDRFIDVIPEIDVPGHTNAALHAIPQLNTAGSSHPGTPEQPTAPVDGTGRVGLSYLDPDSEVSYTFVKHVFTQLAAITPGEYIHIGGDEPHAMVRRHGHDKYVAFIKRTVPMIHALGKKVVGWNEYSAAPLSEGDAVQYWRGATTDVARAVRDEGAKVIVSRGVSSYIDMKYRPDSPFGHVWACSGICDFPQYYDWDPATVIPGITDEGILGNEAPLWSETIRGGEQAEYQIFPRALSHAEIGWTPQELRQTWDFTGRVNRFGQRLLIAGTNFYDSPLAEWEWSMAGIDQELQAGEGASVELGRLAAPGTKPLADGSAIETDLAKDEDGKSSSTLGGGELTMTVDWGDGSEPEPVTFEALVLRDIIHAGSLYSLKAQHTYAKGGTFQGTLTASDGSVARFTAKVAPVEPTVEAPVVADIGPQTAVVGTAITPIGVTASGTTPEISVTGLPDGLTFADGRITGTPTRAGDFTVTVTATNSAGSDTATFTVSVAKAPDTAGPSVEPVGDVSVTVGSSIAPVAVRATDESLPLSFSLSGVPGLSISAAGVISGAPSEVGSFTGTVTVTDAAGNQSAVSFTVEVKAKASPPPPSSPPSPPPTAPGFVRTVPYTKPGLHQLNGRLWMTSCEPYSQTERCRTEIWATVVKLEQGRFVRHTGWAFNNLTYLPFMTRAQWAVNPLGRTGTFIGTDGVPWRTECDTALTGTNACRSFRYTTVYDAVAKPGGGYVFGQENKWVFNNIVMFGAIHR